MPSQQQPSDKRESTLGLIHMVQSVFAAMFGVCGEERRQTDFEEGSITQFIVIGVIFVVIFVLSLIAIVNSILS